MTTTGIRRASHLRDVSVAAPAQARIRVEGVSKRYGEFQVFRNVDLEVGEREIVALVGPSGCGKTTLLRCIDGLLPINEGGIFVEGERVTEPQAGVAMVFSISACSPGRPCSTTSPMD